MEHNIDLKTKEKMKKNLVYVGIFSVIMLFAGFTSAYIVLMGDSFWLKYPMPTAFLISTALVITSSVTFYLALLSTKKNKLNGTKAFMSITVLLGALFVYFQFKGYGELIDRGFYASNNNLLVVDGRYGDYFKIARNEEMIQLNGNDYTINGEVLGEEAMKELKSFVEPFLNFKQGKQINYSDWPSSFTLYFQGFPVKYSNEFLICSNGDTLEFVNLNRMKQLAQNIIDERGDFFAKGTFGKDFQLFYKGEELGYEVDGDDRYLTFQGKPLSASLRNKALQAADSASSFLYIITFVHLLHIAIALLYLLRLAIGSFSGKFSSENYIGLKTGSIFWHFLGLLWVYLLLFLIYIH